MSRRIRHDSWHFKTKVRSQRGLDYVTEAYRVTLTIHFSFILHFFICFFICQILLFFCKCYTFSLRYPLNPDCFVFKLALTVFYQAYSPVYDVVRLDWLICNILTKNFNKFPPIRTLAATQLPKTNNNHATLSLSFLFKRIVFYFLLCFIYQVTLIRSFFWMNVSFGFNCSRYRYHRTTCTYLWWPCTKGMHSQNFIKWISFIFL